MKAFCQRFLQWTGAKYAAFMVVLAPLCFLFPYTHDDWAWGSSWGTRLLDTGFAGYNGRYVGNLLAMALTRSVALRTLVMAVTLTGIVYLIDRVTRRCRPGFFCCVLAIFAMPKLMFSQAVVWTSGFANYAVSVLLVLIYIARILDLVEGRTPRGGAGAGLAMFLLAAFTALIVEHVTLYCVLLGAAALIYARKRFGRCFWPHAGYLAGAIAGAALMFSNSNYASVLSGESVYQRIGLSAGLIDKLGGSVVNYIAPWAFVENAVLNLLLAAGCLLIWRRFAPGMRGRRRAAMTLSCAVVVLFALYCLARRLLPLPRAVSAAAPYLDAVTAMLFVLGGFVFLLSAPVDGGRRTRLFFFALSAGVLAGPFLLVKPVTARCFFATYIMLLLLALELIRTGLEPSRELAAKRKAERARAAEKRRKDDPSGCGLNAQDGAYPAESGEAPPAGTGRTRTGISATAPEGRPFPPRLAPALRAVAALVMVAVFGRLYFVFGANYVCNEWRIAKSIRDAQDNATEITIMNLPYGEYVWRPDPGDASVPNLAAKYKAFYGIDESVQIKGEPYHP